MGGRVFYIGELGQASVIKVITNMLAFIHLVADGEALMLAKRGGIDLKLAWDVIKASSGNSFVHETEGQLILNGSYNINFTMDLARKDLHFAHQMGREFGVPLELAGLTEQLFARARAMYGGGAQSPMVVKMLEDAVGVDLRAPGFLQSSRQSERHSARQKVAVSNDQTCRLFVGMIDLANIVAEYSRGGH
jgi:3-hydroxyisobutyrate dehydrogenase